MSQPGRLRESTDVDVDTGFISIEGAVCPPAMEPKLDPWYASWHIPQSMKFSGTLAVSRYRFAAPGGDAAVGDYPDHLIIRRFGDVDALEAWHASEARAVAWERFDALRAGGVTLAWQAAYRHIRGWKDTAPTPLMSMTAIHCDAHAEAAVDQWYSDKHVPDLLAFREIRGVSRYRLANVDAGDARSNVCATVSEYPRFVTVYQYPDMATAEAFDRSPERAAARPDWLAVAKQTHAFPMWRVRYAPLGTWER